jgi:hypothetical protein
MTKQAKLRPVTHARMCLSSTSQVFLVGETVPVLSSHINKFSSNTLLLPFILEGDILALTGRHGMLRGSLLFKPTDF